MKFATLLSVRPKVSIIGSGNVGSTLVSILAARDLCDIVLLSRTDGEPQGKALDLAESLPLQGVDSRIVGTTDYKDTHDSDIVVITAGLPRTPGMSRDELLAKNAEIVQSVTKQAVKFSPNSILIVVTNPLDVTTYLAWKASKLPPKKVIGMAGILDSTRMRYFIAEAAHVSVKDVSALVLGGHGDTMIPILRYASINGIPASEFLDTKTLDQIVERTRKGGEEIVNLLKTGSAYYAPALAVTEMVEAIVKNSRRVLPCAAYLNGEYGVQDLFIGVPIVLGAQGVEKIIELEFNKDEHAAFQKTVKHVETLVKPFR